MFCGEQIVLSLCVLLALDFTSSPVPSVSMLDANVFRQFLRFPRSIRRAKFFCANIYHRSLVNGTFFLYPQKNTFCVLRFRRSITDWIGFGLGGFGEFYMLNFSTRLLNEFTEWLLFNCRTQFIIPSSPIVIVSQ